MLRLNLFVYLFIFYFIYLFFFYFINCFFQGTGQIGRIGNRHIFVIRKNQASGIVGVTDDTAHFQWKDIYIEYSP